MKTLLSLVLFAALSAQAQTNSLYSLSFAGNINGIDSTHFNYLLNLTSDVQTQLNAKGAGTVTSISGDGTFTSGTITGSGSLSPVANPTFGGVNITGINAANIASGTLADARTSANIPKLNGTNANTGTNSFSAPVTHTDVVTNMAAVKFGSAQQTVVNASGLVTSYNGDTTAGNGLASVIGAVSQVNVAGAASGPTTIFTAGSSTTQMYLMSCYFEVTTIGSSGTITLTVNWTDDNGAQSSALVSAANLAAKTATTPAPKHIHPANGTAVTYTITTGSPVGSPLVSYYLAFTRVL